MANMFQQAPRPAGHVHVEFKAGRCDWDGKTVTPQKQKGKVILVTKEDEGLMHFQWMDRGDNQVKVDLIVINDAYLQRIEKVKDGRVYLLRFTSSEKKLFFWMQEPKDEKDEELINTFNSTIGATIPDKKSGGAAAPAAAPAPSAGLPGANQPIDPAIRAIVQQFIQQQAGPRTPPVPLQAVLTTDVLQNLNGDDAAVSELAGLLPAGSQTPEDVRTALASPQLQQTMGALSQAIHSDQLMMLFHSLGLDSSVISSAAPGSDALELLIRAMEGSSPPKPDDKPADGA